MIAKLDRSARNVAFIANLMEASGFEFVAVDMPLASRCMEPSEMARAKKTVG